MEENNQGSGLLQIRTYTAGGALPVERAQVFVYDGTEQDDALLYSVLTGEGGLSPKLSLTTPPKQAGETPNGGKPYALYRVRVNADGYYPVLYEGIPIYDGVLTSQPVSLLPVLEGTREPQTQVFPPFTSSL